MIYNVKCSSCEDEFGLDQYHISKDGFVRDTFKCPYCGKEYKRGDRLTPVGTSGGVNINGNVHVGGNIVGGDMR